MEVFHGWGARVMMVQVLMTVIKEQQKKTGSSTFHLLVCNPIPDRLGIWRIHRRGGGGDHWRALSCYKLSEGTEILGSYATSPRPQRWWHICESIFLSCIFTVISKFLTISKLLWLFIWLIQWVCDSGMVIFFFLFQAYTCEIEAQRGKGFVPNELPCKEWRWGRNGQSSGTLLKLLSTVQWMSSWFTGKFFP